MATTKNRKNIVITVGKRKTAVARATVKAGKGEVTINGKPHTEFLTTAFHVMKVEEPLLIADMTKKVDIKVNVRGGGCSSQTDAIRQAIARGLIAFTKDEDVKEAFVAYDRSLVVSDTRFKEICKPNDSKARAKRQKSYR